MRFAIVAAVLMTAGASWAGKASKCGPDSSYEACLTKPKLSRAAAARAKQAAAFNDALLAEDPAFHKFLMAAPYRPDPDHEDPRILYVAVPEWWNEQPKEWRLSKARLMLRLWRGVRRHPHERSDASLSIVVADGDSLERVGGSRFFSSDAYVDD